LLHFIKFKVERDKEARDLIKFYKGGLNIQYLKKITLMNFFYEIYLANILAKEEKEAINGSAI